jgi:membrane-bound ClpP family serine protease
MTLEVAYWIALAVGGTFLLLSIVLGDIFDFLDFLDFDLGDGFSATPVFFTAVAAFGGGGLLGIQAFNMSTGTSVFAGLGAGILFGAMAAALFSMLRRQEAGEGFTKARLVGARGRCVLAIQPGREGRVAVAHEGMTRTLTATSAEPVAVGEEIVVVDIVGDSLRVTKAGAEAAAEGG